MEQENNATHYYRKLLKVGGITLALLALLIFSKTITEMKGWSLIGKDVPLQTTITVSGKGEVVVKPDIATFSFGIQQESLVVADAQDKVAKSENEILSFLKKEGVALEDIKVSGYNIYPRYDYVRSDTLSGGRQVLAGYVVSESVEVKVRKIGDAGSLIGSLGELGATNISGLSFGIDDDDAVQAQAREEAIADAQANAKKLAKELGVSLARVVSFSENGNYPPGPIYYAKAEMAMDVGRGGATPELPSGTNKVTSQVSITYEIR
ncbi:MAG: SIMPL domain-containing protein [Candidatus Taylorbacteria bacterium]|nr:SIMPL domain-containing protein [Candidatus Taylorbacteria bacterium]